MTLPKSITAYNDVAALLHQLLARDGGKYILPTKREAVRFAARSYKYRELFREQEAVRQGLPRDYQVPTPFDNMKISRTDETLSYSFTRALTGQLIFPDGEAVEAHEVRSAPPPVEPAPVDDSLAEMARQLMELKRK